MRRIILLASLLGLWTAQGPAATLWQGADLANLWQALMGGSDGGSTFDGGLTWTANPGSTWTAYDDSTTTTTNPPPSSGENPAGDVGPTLDPNG